MIHRFRSVIAISVALSGLLCLAGHAFCSEIVARFDGRSITVGDLSTYVDEVVGEKYRYLLGDAAGLRTLTDYYVNRALLMNHARKMVKKDDALLKTHGARQMDEDAMYLTALLKAEVQDRVRIDAAQVDAHMDKTGADRMVAERELATAQRTQLMNALIATVRKGHTIEYLK